MIAIVLSLVSLLLATSALVALLPIAAEQERRRREGASHDAPEIDRTRYYIASAHRPPSQES